MKITKNPFSLDSPRCLRTRDEMTESEFQEMMAIGLAQA